MTPLIRPFKKLLVVSVIGGALLVASAVGNAASAQAAADPLYACYVPSSGTVYRIRTTNAPPACVDPTHVAFSWNTAGPKGDAGVAGGPGSPGVSALQTVSQSVSCSSGSANFCDATAVCPTGKTVLSGGIRTSGGSGQWNVTDTAPVSGGGGTGWYASAEIPAGQTGSINVTVFAICAVVVP